MGKKTRVHGLNKEKLRCKEPSVIMCTNHLKNLARLAINSPAYFKLRDVHLRYKTIINESVLRWNPFEAFFKCIRCYKCSISDDLHHSGSYDLCAIFWPPLANSAKWNKAAQYRMRKMFNFEEACKIFILAWYANPLHIEFSHILTHAYTLIRESAHTHHHTNTYSQCMSAVNYENSCH